jgi:hypothetical protein
VDKVAAQRRSHALAERATSLVNALHEGLWLGLLDRDELQRVTDRYYREPRSTFLQTGHVWSGPFPWEQRALAEHFRSCRSVLVAGAGSGRELAWLHGAGKHVRGFDCVPELVEHGNAVLTASDVPARIEHAPPDVVPDGLGVFDGAVIGWGAYSHILGRDRRLAFVQALRTRVERGGPLLVSFLSRPERSRRTRLILGVARAVRAARRSPDGVEAGDVVADAAWHLFTEDELRRELEAAGFETVEYDPSSLGFAVARAV